MSEASSPAVVKIERTPFGPAAPALGWVPAPRYLLRRSRILAALRQCSPGAFLEVGCGAGAMLCELSELGFDCSGLETSESARELAGRFCGSYRPNAVRLFARPAWSEPFDYVAAFEVLEHIEDDTAALREWVSWLRPQGRLLLSVPARQRRWSDSDVWAGHFRRYERQSLLSLLRDAGLKVTRFECYGFPLSNLVEPVRARVHGRSMRAEVALSQDRQQMTDRSGTDRAGLVRLHPYYGCYPGAAITATFCQLQRLFLQNDLGTGYFLVAERRAT